MLNTIYSATGLQLEYVREEFFKFLFLNTVQYILKDAEENLYYFIISFDSTQDFFMDREVKSDNSENDRLIWSGTVFNKRCSLYRYFNSDEKTLSSKKIKTFTNEEVILSPEIITRIENNFLQSYPEKYQTKIRSLREYKKCFEMLSCIDKINVSREYGLFCKEQIEIVDDETVLTLCNFHYRDYQPAGYNEFIFNKVFGKSNKGTENRQFNFAKYCLEQKINEIIHEFRKPLVDCSIWKSTEDHRELFALNNFPEIYPKNENYILNISTDYADYFMPLSIDNDRAKIGTWLNNIGRESLTESIKFIFKRFKKIKSIEYNNILYDLLLDHGWKHNDFYLPLPETIDELKSRLATKSRYNLRRERRIVQEDFNGLQLVNIPFDKATQEQINSFYRFKNETHGITIEEYDITKRNVTDLYLLQVGEGEIKGVAISCEQGNVVFLENHTYDSSQRKYSFGQILYDMYLDEMVKKGMLGVALAGGNLEYKKRYGTYCAIARSGEIIRPIYRWMCLSEFFGIDFRDRLFRRISNKLKLKCGNSEATDGTKI